MQLIVNSPKPDKTELKSPNNHQRRCLYCGQLAQLIWVHGHGQCASCGINVDECCRGEHCEFYGDLSEMN